MKPIVKKSISYLLKAEAELVLWKYKPKIIAITGSVGKTSTKDAVYAVLADVVHVRKSEKSFNSEIGLPLTILGLPNGWNNMWAWAAIFLKGLWLFLWPHKYPEWLVLEVGISKPGDMYKTASWLSSDIVIITAIGETPAHIEFFESRKHLVDEKAQLIRTLKPDGILILNKDDDTVFDLKSRTKNIIVSYGFAEGADISGSSDTIAYNEKGEPEGVIFRVDSGGKSFPVVIGGVFGRNHVYASLAALAVSYALKLNMLSAAEALKDYGIPPGRMRLLKGINETLIIDDTYNSSPFACESALKTLGNIKFEKEGRKIAILGDMLELGKHTAEAHKTVGKFAAENADLLFVVGQRATGIKQGAIEAGMQGEIKEFSDSKEAANFLKTFIEPGDLILVKGSQGRRMERIVEAILLDKKNKSKLLVRQEKEWRSKA